MANSRGRLPGRTVNGKYIPLGGRVPRGFHEVTRGRYAGHIVPDEQAQQASSGSKRRGPGRPRGSKNKTQGKRRGRPANTNGRSRRTQSANLTDKFNDQLLSNFTTAMRTTSKGDRAFSATVGKLIQGRAKVKGGITVDEALKELGVARTSFFHRVGTQAVLAMALLINPNLAEDEDEDESTPSVKSKRGRPRGSKNRSTQSAQTSAQAETKTDLQGSTEQVGNVPAETAATNTGAVEVEIEDDDSDEDEEESKASEESEQEVEL